MILSDILGIIGVLLGIVGIGITLYIARVANSLQYAQGNLQAAIAELELKEKIGVIQRASFELSCLSRDDKDACRVWAGLITLERDCDAGFAIYRLCGSLKETSTIRHDYCQAAGEALRCLLKADLTDNALQFALMLRKELIRLRDARCNDLATELEQILEGVYKTTPPTQQMILDRAKRMAATAEHLTV